MAQRERPSEDEIDRFVELYDELGSIRAVSEHDDVEWSHESVRTWLHDRGVLGGTDDDGMDVPSETPDEPSGEAVTETPATTAPPEELRENKSPNDILAEVVDADPGVGEKVVNYLESRMEALGVLGTNDIRGAFQQLSNIQNKHQTVSRILQEYQARCNKLLRENPNLQYDDQWAMLLMKETGTDPRQGAGGNMMGASGGITQPQRAPGGGMGGAGGQGGIGAPQTAPGQPRTNGYQPQQRPPQGGQVGGGQQAGGAPNQRPEPRGETTQNTDAPAGGQTGGGGGGDDEFAELAKEYFREEVLGSEDDSEPEASPTDELSEALEAVQQIEDMRDDIIGGETDDGGDSVDAVQALDSRLAQLETSIQQAVAESNSDTQPVQTEGKMSDFMEIAQIAQEFDDPDLVEQLIKLQSDPDIVEAQAELEEAKGSANLKQQLVQSISPQVTEKAVESLFNITNGLSTAVENEAGQAQQQPTPQREQTTSATDNVEVVEDDTPKTPSGSPNRPPELDQTTDDGEDTEAEAETSSGDDANTEETVEEDEK